eukprot:748970-Hanusia_phi.AAC.1
MRSTVAVTVNKPDPRPVALGIRSCRSEVPGTSKLAGNFGTAPSTPARFNAGFQAGADNRCQARIWFRRSAKGRRCQGPQLGNKIELVSHSVGILLMVTVNNRSK